MCQRGTHTHTKSQSNWVIHEVRIKPLQHKRCPGEGCCLGGRAGDPMTAHKRRAGVLIHGYSSPDVEMSLRKNWPQNAQMVVPTSCVVAFGVSVNEWVTSRNIVKCYMNAIIDSDRTESSQGTFLDNTETKHAVLCTFPSCAFCQGLGITVDYNFRLKVWRPAVLTRNQRE